ncbi:MAG: hypothetical protein QW568_01740 [Candidatus Anstonellaceae archaeon]
MRFAALFAFAAFAFMLLAPTLHADTAACMIAQTRSYMDIILDEPHNTSEVFVYNLSKNYRKNGIERALIYRADLSNLTNITVCFEVADDGSVWGTKGLAKFKYDPNVDGCIDYWYIFCPQYSGGGGQPTIADQQACLNGTSLRLSAGSVIDNPILRCSPAQNSLTPIAHPEYFPSHNGLYICNQRPKDYAPLCWPLMLIFALLVGANYAVGKNPFQAFDFSSPRMNRGRQYTARVQQKSFDLMGYLMAADKAVETAGKAFGTKEKAVRDGDGNLIGTADKEGVVRDSEGNVKGRLEDGKFVAGEMKGGKMVDGKLVGATFVKADTQPVNAMVITTDAQWKGPTGLLTGLVGGALGGALGKVAGWLSKSDKEGGKVITDDKHNVVGEVNSKGQIIKDGKVIGAVVDGKIVMNDKKDARTLSIQTIGKEVLDKNGNVIGRVYSDGKIRDEETGQLKGSYDARTKTVTGTDGKVIEGANLRGMAIEIAGKADAADAIRKGSAEDKGQTQKDKYHQSVTAQSPGAIYTASDILAIFNLFSDKPGKPYSQEDADKMKEMGKISPEKQAAMGWDNMTQQEKDRAQTWQNLKDMGSFVWGKLKQSIGLDFGKDGWALSLLKLLSAMSTLSTYMRGAGAAFGSKGMAGGISFIENLNNNTTLFRFPGSTVSFGSFASYLDPSYAGGAGLPYGMQALSPIFETAAQAGKAGISITENMLRGRGAPEADYVAGYSGFGVNFIVAADKSYYAIDEQSGKTLTKSELLKKLEKQEGTEKLIDLIRNGRGRDDKGNVVDANTANLSENMKNSGLSQFWGKIGRDGQMAGISEDEFKSGLNAQLRYTETRNQTLGLLLRYVDSPKLDSDDARLNNKYSSEIIGKGKMSIGRLVEGLDNYSALDENSKAQLTSALEDYKNGNLIGNYSLETRKGRQDLMDDLKEVQKTVGKIDAAREWNLIYIQASNSKRQIDSLNYMIGNLDKGVAGIQTEMGNYQAYLTAEVEARRAHGLFVDMGAGGALSTALQQLDLDRKISELTEKMKSLETEKGKESEEYRKLSAEKERLESKVLDFEKLKNEQQAEVDKLANLDKQGTSEYIHAIVELQKLDKTQQIYEALKSGKNIDEADLNRIDSEVRAICQNAYARASALDSAANLIYETELKGLPREQMLENLSSFNAAMGALNMADGSSSEKLNWLSSRLNYAASMLGGIDDNAWRRMTPEEKREITKKFGWLQEATSEYFDTFSKVQDRISMAKTRAEHIDAEAPLKLASLKVDGSRLDLLISIMETRDYEGPNRDQQFMQEMREVLSKAMLNANVSLWKGGELENMSLEQKEALVKTADKISWFSNQMVIFEKGLYQTSDFFVNEMARGNLGQARFAGDLFGAGDQKFLEGNDPYKQSTKMFPRMAVKGAADYQYGDIKLNIPRWEGIDMPGKPEAPAQPAVAAAAMQFREYIQTLNPRQRELDNFVSDASRRMVDYLTSNPNKNVVMSVSVPNEHWNREKYNEKLESTLIKEIKEGVREELAKEGYSKSEIDNMMKRITVGAAENPEMTFSILSDRVNEENWKGIQQQFVNTQYADEKKKGSKAYKAAVFSGDGDLLSKDLSQDTFKALLSAKTYEEFKAGLKKASSEYSDPIYFSNAPQKDVKSVYDIDRTAYIGTSDMFETDENGNYKIKDQFKPKE